MKFAWQPLFNSSDHGGWSTLNKQQPIPQRLWSEYRQANSKPSVISLGILRAVLNILQGNVRFTHDASGVGVEYEGSKGRSVATSHILTTALNTRQRFWHLPSPSAVVYLALGEAWWQNTIEFDELNERWTALMIKLEANSRSTTLGNGSCTSIRDCNGQRPPAPTGTLGSRPWACQSKHTKIACAPSKNKLAGTSSTAETSHKA